MVALVLAFVAFLATLAGGYLALKNQNQLQKLLGLTAGIVLGVVIFGLLPEIFELSEGNYDIHIAMIALMAGFLLFHIIEKTILISHSDDSEYGEHHHPYVGWVSAAALAGHSLLDGLAIGLAFQTNTVIGVALAVAVIAHSFSDGLNTVNIMLANKNNPVRAKIMLLIDALAPVTGVLLSFVLSVGQTATGMFLAFFAGFLLYIAASEILPEAHSKKSSYFTIVLTVLGATLMYFITGFGH